MPCNQHDVFISYAHEDKDYAKPLASELTSLNVTCWFDENQMQTGDFQGTKIDNALRHSRAAALILSPVFYEKHWTMCEKRLIMIQARANKIKLLPIRHGVPQEKIAKHDILLGDTVAVDSTQMTVAEIAETIAFAIKAT